MSRPPSRIEMRDDNATDPEDQEIIDFLENSNISELLEDDMLPPLPPISETTVSNIANTTHKPSSVRVAKWWKIVIGFMDSFGNNDIFSTFSNISSKFAFQEELSAEEFHHWQCCLGLKKKTTKSKVIKLLSHLGGSPNISADFCNNPLEYIDNYVTKEDTRVSGPWSKGIKGIANEPVKTIKKEDFKMWQNAIHNQIQLDPDDRTIHWYYDIQGNTGKTSMAKYLVVHCGAFLFKGGSNDMANRIISSNTPPRVCVMNLSRTQEQYVSYQTIEDLKDGLLCSGKYEGGQLAFNSPHVIIFANFRPDENKLSADRWDIHCIDDALYEV